MYSFFIKHSAFDRLQHKTIGNLTLIQIEMVAPLPRFYLLVMRSFGFIPYHKKMKKIFNINSLESDALIMSERILNHYCVAVFSNCDWHINTA